MKLKFDTLPELFTILYFISFQFCSHLFANTSKGTKSSSAWNTNTRDLRTLNCSDQSCFWGNQDTFICNSTNKKWALTSLEFPSAKIGCGRRAALYAVVKYSCFLNVLEKFQSFHGHSKLEMHTVRTSKMLVPVRLITWLSVPAEFHSNHNHQVQTNP